MKRPTGTTDDSFLLRCITYLGASVAANVAGQNILQRATGLENMTSATEIAQSSAVGLCTIAVVGLACNGCKLG